MKAAEAITSFAKVLIGQQEKPGNSGFKSEWIEKKMKERGFVPGDAWCALAAELVLYEAYQGTIFEEYIDRLFSKSAVETYRNFSLNGPFPCNQIPVPGAVAIWQLYKNGVKTWQGHAGIVESVRNGFYFCIEGNSNSKGGREGFEWAYRKRDFSKPDNGLRLLGFIHPANLDL